MVAAMRLASALSLALFLFGLSACGARTGGSTLPHRTEGASRSWQEEADDFLDFYDPTYRALYTESARAAWLSSTDVSEEHTGGRAAADTALYAFAGSAFVIERARALLAHREELDALTARQLDFMLILAAQAPQLDPELARRRVAAEAAAAAALDGFEFCMARDAAGTCTTPTDPNAIDGILVESRDLSARLSAWNASKEVGTPLRSHLLELRDLRNGVARAMGYDDYFALMVSNYGMSTDELMALLDQLIVDISPLYTQLQCYARYELAGRYGVTDVPSRIPAHWLANRWGQAWPGLSNGIDMDALVADRDPTWITETAERFYTSMGFEELPDTFWTASDLYPVPAGDDREKNDHASAWHMDLGSDVRSLMSVESNWRWFTTAHHELGHIYYYMSYARPEVPYLLREGANRSYHEGIGDLIALAAGQEPYLREVGILPEGTEIDETAWLLDDALNGPIVFLPWSAGVMSHFERDLYAGELPEAELNTRWWEHVARFQGIEPPSARPVDGCDACTKTHIIDDPAGYYDYALANVLLYQLHDHICRNILEVDPHQCNYYGHREVGDFLRGILSPGASRDWREVLIEATGRDLTAEPMLEYYRPLMSFLEERNAGRECGF